jgi:hypothetical protein
MGMGNGAADTFGANVDITNSGSSNFRLAYNSPGNTVAGDITALNTGTANNLYLSSAAASTLSVTGNVTFTDNSSDADHDNYIGNNGDLTIGGDLTISNLSPGDRCDIFVAGGTDSQVSVAGTTTVTNNGTGAIVSRVFLGYNGDCTFEDLTITNSSASDNSEVALNDQANSSNIYNSTITLVVDNANNDGIRFGEDGGSGTLPAGQTVTIGGGGFIAGDLRFRNFTQVGPTAQSLTCTGTARIYNYDSNWGGNVVFTAPRILTRGTVYNGTAELEKTGGIGDDQSAGGNTFVGNTILRNSGSAHFMMGNGTADDFQANLEIVNNGTDEMYIAHNSTGNTIAGALTVTNANTGTRVEFCDNTSSTLTVTGDATFNNTSTAATTNIMIAENGDIDFDGALTINTNCAGTNSYLYLANGTNSAVTIDGPFNFNHLATSTNNTRAYLGNQGDITFNDVLTVVNSSTGNNSEIFLNHNPNSNNLYNEDIILSATIAGGDGIFFGQANGAGILAATRTVTIGGGGFVSGDLQFRNFTQLGPTPQSLTCSGTARIYNYDSNWGGDVNFVAPRMNTRGTIYNGTSLLEKSGGVGDDQSAGGNTFVGNCALNNSGDNYFMMGNGNPDDWQSDLTVNNSGTDDIFLCHNSTGNTMSGTVVMSMTNTADRIEICDNSNSTLTVTGPFSITNNSTSVTNTIILAENGDIDFDNSVLIDNLSGGTTSRVTIANGTNSSVTVDGDFTFNHNSTATNDTRAYLGSNGDIVFNGVTTIVNGTGAPDSHIYCNLNPNSSNAYNNDLIVSVTNAASDGIRFGQSGGFGTLAATRTVTIGVGGFIAGDLRFRNFTQVGPTAQALTCTGTARIYNYDSDWGGDITFIAPRMLTRGTLYNGTSYLEKTGVDNDVSVGGNTFIGNCELIHTGSNQFLMGNGMADIWQSDLTVLNNGSGNMYIAYDGAGHSIAGTLDWTHAGNAVDDVLASQTNATLNVTGSATFTNTSSATGEIYAGNNGDVTFDGTVTGTNAPTGAANGQIRFANGTNSLVTFNDNLDLTNNGTGTTHSIYLGNNGDVDLNGDLSLSNSGSGSNSYIYIASATNSTVTINGSTAFSQTGNINNTRSYLGNQGDIVFNGTLDIVNQSSSNNSEVFLNHDDNSLNVYNGNVTVTSENASCDGVRFGEGNGNGTLAAGNTILVGSGGFVAGDLYFRNFTQLGGTAQNIVCTGTARILQRTSAWSGNLSCTAPRFTTRETIYDGTADITKNGAGNDDSAGGNTFNGTTIITNSGSGRMRLSTTNSLVDDFNADVTFIESGSGDLQPSRNNTDTYAGNININSNTSLYFGEAGNGRVLFDGAAGDQDINDIGTSPTPRFRDFHVNKASGEVNCNMPVEIIVELDLDQGVVNTSTANLMTMRDNSIVSSVSDASHIDGPIEKIGNDVFTFPVGDSSVYRPISISAPANGSSRFRAEYFKVDPHPTYNDQSLDITLDHISSCEYWLLDRTNGTNNVNVTLSWDFPTSCEVTDLPELAVARWDGAIWRDEGNGGTTGTIASGTIVTSAPVTNFSPFTLASYTSNNPLPVELLSFDAKLNNDQVDLKWITLSESDNDYFDIEKSRDGQNWAYLMTVDGAGNSVATINYSAVDEKPYTGVNYYRLKQVDFNGEYEYSSVAKVNVPFNNIGNLVLYPNPTNDVLYIEGDQNELEQIKVLSITGQQIETIITISSGVAIIDLTSFADGIYFVETPYSIQKVIKK